MFPAPADRILPTTIVGSYPRPHGYTESLRGRPLKLALADAEIRAADPGLTFARADR